MRYVHIVLVGIRNIYVAVMFLPLWLWSAAYRYGFFERSWLNASWNTFSILALLYGAFGLWFFAERAVETHYSGKSSKSLTVSIAEGVVEAHYSEKPSRGLTVSVWAIAVTLFVACFG